MDRERNWRRGESYETEKKLAEFWTMIVWRSNFRGCGYHISDSSHIESAARTKEEHYPEIRALGKVCKLAFIRWWTPRAPLEWGWVPIVPQGVILFESCFPFLKRRYFDNLGIKMRNAARLFHGLKIWSSAHNSERWYVDQKSDTRPPIPEIIPWWNGSKTSFEMRGQAHLLGDEFLRQHTADGLSKFCFKKFRMILPIRSLSQPIDRLFWSR
jgi:hypothetical protein